MAHANIHAVILAGGASSRFWPMDDTPKYLIKPDGQTTLLEHAYRRCLGFAPKERIHIVTAEAQAAVIQTALPGIKATQVIVEPSARDTLAAVTLAMARIAEIDKEAIVVVTAADGHFEPNECFVKPLEAAIHKGILDDSRLCCFGVKPTRPETGFGYIERGSNPYAVKRFTEKPDDAKAKAFIASDNYLWNVGAFAWRAQAFMAEVERQRPGLVQGIRAYLTEKDAGKRRALYAALEKTSVDFGVMEGASNLGVIEIDAAFDDIGTWDALSDLGQLKSNNAIQIDANNNAALSRSKVAFVGVDDLILIEHNGRILVMKRGHGQQVKQAAQLDAKDRAP